MGSVKFLGRQAEPTEQDLGSGRFHFSDAYSVFDFGEMPNSIPGKGIALNLIGAYCFERAREQGLRTHYKGIVSDGRITNLSDINKLGLQRLTNVMDISLVRVIKPVFQDGEYDYSMFHPGMGCMLSPLERIYRNSLVENSSLHKRLQSGKAKPEDFGLDHMPKPGERFEPALLDVSTKLEETDRYITWVEAQRIAGLTDGEVEEINRTTLIANDIITEVAKKAGMVNEDGKLEYAYGPIVGGSPRELMVVDVFGTLDESRFTYKGIHVSKEIARQIYRKTKWHDEVEKAKAHAKERGIKDWRQFCSNPPPLDEDIVNILSNMYKSTANAILRDVFEGNVFDDTPRLEDVLTDYETWQGSDVHRSWLREHAA